MLGANAGEVVHLVSTRGARRDENGPIRHRPGGRQQTALADGPRHVEVIARIPERPGHPAAPSVKIDHRRAGDSLQQCLGRRDETKRLLVAVPMQEELGRSGGKGKLGAPSGQLILEEILKQGAGFGHLLRLLLLGVSEE